MVSATLTKFRLSPTTAHAEIARGWNTIFGPLKVTWTRNVNLPRYILVPYCRDKAATKPLHQAIEFAMLAMFRSGPICGCVEPFLLY
jgi:hypothetical protein